MTYAEVILPLPIRANFTYSVPEEMIPFLQTGSRVLVQFGRKKFYTGIISHTHQNKPEYEVKPISEIMDNHPIIRYPQLNLWRWIAEYYLCTEGDVMKAALPSGLKPESETYVALIEDFESESKIKLTDKQSVIISLLQTNGRMKIADIENELKIRNSTKIISSLLEAGIVRIDERLVERYHAKTETFVLINSDRKDTAKIKQFFELVKRSQQQETLLVAWLDLSGWLHPERKPKEVTRNQLLAKAECSPNILKALVDKEILKIEKRPLNRFNPQDGHHEPSLASLSDLQSNVYQEILNQFHTANRPVLLHGVTGSGKTEIYSHLIAAALHDGNQVLYLVPEISLTTQLTDRLRKMFGNKLLVYHSKFSDNERVDIWKRLLNTNEPLVILGVRSSVFLPFAHLGLVIIDEEHESSYKQYDPAPRYNARDTAMVLAQMHGAHVLMGSATPAVETYWKAISGKFGLVTLNQRYEGALLPDVEIVDMRKQRKEKLNRGILSKPLSDSIKNAISHNYQTIVFQNRRGFAPLVICRECGWTPKCENCDVSMVFHKQSNLLKCHYCGSVKVLPNICPACGSNAIDTFGYGTERIAEDIHNEFPDVKIARMDLDSTRNKDAYQKIIEDFASHTTDILVGTQMVTKGLDFKDVNIVAVTNADTLLNFPDFRSNERAFNMLEQVAGRAGRRKIKGKVIIQATKPDDPILNFVKNHDYTGFYNSEILEREKYGYPPFTKIVNIFIKHKDYRICNRVALAYSQELRTVFGERVLGPEQPFVGRVALYYIQQIMLKVENYASMKKVKEIIQQIYNKMSAFADFRSSIIYFDVDPA